MQSYAYSLLPSGHRTQVTEASGRTVGYTFDNQYRLTSETITGDPKPALNGRTDWEYDLVGNRLSQQTDIGDLLDHAETYSANDWLNSHTYDDNGNTTASSTYDEPAVVLNDVYDWRNRLVRREKSDGTVIEVVYDGFGDRIKKTVTPFGGEADTTWFLVDRNNLTGYAQVVEEIAQGGDVEVIYTYGLDLISQDRRDGDGSGNFTQSFYLYDGLGSVRGLTDSSGAITDTYTYDAWGVQLVSSGSTRNDYRFTGEQWDEDFEMYFLRARYLNTATGRFHTMDTFEGVATDPVTLHKYLYAAANPISYIDPSGLFSLANVSATTSVVGILQKMAIPSLVAGFNVSVQARLYMVLKPLADELSILANLMYDLNPQASNTLRNLAMETRKRISIGRMAFEVALPTGFSVIGGKKGAALGIGLAVYRAYALESFASQLIEKAAQGVAYDGSIGYFSIGGSLNARTSLLRIFTGQLNPAQDLRHLTDFVIAWRNVNPVGVVQSFYAFGNRLAEYGDFNGQFGFRTSFLQGRVGVATQSGRTGFEGNLSGQF